MATLSYARWVAFIERRHRSIIAASLVLGLVSAFALTRLRLDIDVLSMLPQGTRAFDDFRGFVGDFGQLNELIVLLRGEPSALRPFADAFAVQLARLDSVGAVRARVEVDSIRDGLLQEYLPNYIAEADYDEIAQRLTADAINEQIGALRAILSAPFDLSSARALVQDPLGLQRYAGRTLAGAYSGSAAGSADGYIVSADGQALLLFVRPTGSAFEIDFSERLMRDVRAAEADTRVALAAHDQATSWPRVAYSGSYVYALEDAGTLRADISRYTGLALVGVLAVFYLGYRSFRILPFVAYPLALTTLFTFALSLLLFEQLNAVSLSFAAILYGLSIDTGIHFYTRLLQERTRGAAGRDDLVAATTATLKGLGRATVLSSLTTAAAFGALALSSLSAIRELGVLTAVGMGLTVLEFFTLYPALGFLLARRMAVGGIVIDTPWVARWVDGAIRHARAIKAVSLLLAIAAVALASREEFSAGLARLRPAESAAVRVQEEIEGLFGGRHGGGAVVVRRPDIERALVDSAIVAARAREYQREGMLSAVQSVDALLPSADVQRARLARYNALPRAASVATARASLAAAGFVPDRFDGSLERLIPERHDVVRFGTPALAPLAVAIEHYVRVYQGQYLVATYLEPAPAVPWRVIATRLHHDLGEVEFDVAARGLLEEELHTVLQRELLLFVLLGLGGNAVLLLVGLGQVREVVVMLASVVLVVLVLFAGMWLAGVEIDPINVIVTPVLFGVGVDYGVYVVVRARELGSLPGAGRAAGRALLTTALTTIAGFGFLGLSHYPPLAAMGLLAGGGLMLCVFFALTVLPAWLPRTGVGNVESKP